MATDGSVDYVDESAELADRFDLVVTQVEYRHSGRETRHPLPDRTYDIPYDLCKLQTIDCLRATRADEDTAYKAVLKYCGETLRTVCHADASLLPAFPVSIPVRDGTFVVTYSAVGPTLTAAF